MPNNISVLDLSALISYASQINDLPDVVKNTTPHICSCFTFIIAFRFGNIIPGTRNWKIAIVSSFLTNVNVNVDSDRW